MADTEALKERILKEAREEAERIRKKAEQREEEILKKAEEKGAQRKEEIIEEARRRAEANREREITLARLRRRNKILNAKQNEISSVFNIVLERSGNLKEAGYKKLLKRMILSEVQNGDEELVLCDRDRERFGEEFLEELNAQLEKRGLQGALSYAEDTVQMSGGFILKKDGIENNNSFEMLLSMQREELAAEVAEILFSLEG